MLERKLTVCTYDVLPDGNLKPSAFQKYCQQIAVDDVSATGATYRALKERGMAFVLMRYAAAFPKEVRATDEVVLKTHAYKCDGVMFYRCFELHRDGDLVAVADTRWVLLDIRKRTILRPAQYTFRIEETAPGAPLPEIDRRIPVEKTDARAERRVRFTEMDENGHLNNCSYTDWAIDDAPLDLDRVRIKSVCIHFDHEAYRDDLLELSYQKNPDGCSLNAFDRTENRSCFSAVLKTEPKTGNR